MRATTRTLPSRRLSLSDPLPQTAIIAAASENGVIGRGGDLPWRIPTDFAFFKEKTLGHTLVMGRRTHLSIGRPLPGRRTIVVTRSSMEGVETAKSLQAALDMAGRPAFLCGGAQIYADGMAFADTIYLTRIHAVVDGDTHFPPIDEEAFVCTSVEEGVQSERDEFPFTFLTFRRRSAPAG
ncbi:MAG: dihydrofolate reductase [Pseudomonadota bacterium]